ncbi:MAG: hypothetical protein V4585_20185 [Bacteroidota bacterium]
MKNQLKYYLLFIPTSAILLGCSDAGKKYEEVEEAKTCSMIFIDKSVSVNVNKKFVNEKYTQVINQLIDENVKGKGDKIEVYFVHENTAKGKAVEVVSRTEKGESAGASSTDSEAISTEYAMSMDKERSIFKKIVFAQLASQNTSSSKNNTDILAALPLIDKAVSKGYNVKVYFLSDMVESMKGDNRRDFHTNPPVDDAAAVGWAREDADDLKVKLPNIGAAQIFIAKPFEPTASRKKNNPAISAYWQRLFMELGVSSEVVEL